MASPKQNSTFVFFVWTAEVYVAGTYFYISVLRYRAYVFHVSDYCCTAAAADVSYPAGFSLGWSLELLWHYSSSSMPSYSLISRKHKEAYSSRTISYKSYHTHLTVYNIIFWIRIFPRTDFGLLSVCIMCCMRSMVYDNTAVRSSTVVRVLDGAVCVFFV